MVALHRLLDGVDPEVTTAAVLTAGEIDFATDRLPAPAYDTLSATARLTPAFALVRLAQAAATELPFPNAMGLPRHQA